ncbi:hypothetical protein GCM10009547_49500 [Sporichthya brevicatena]|uniref:Uncharacterized protein n=1 Tax=Sporichthya brevicatena TaxID=171442 RepID=A0ABP3SHN7_9ACTN
MADLERHIPMAERLDNDPGDAGRMARSFLAAMARLAEVEAERDCAVNLWAGEVAKVAEQRERAKAAEAKLAAVREEYDAWNEENLGHVPGIENTNWPDAWAGIGTVLALIDQETEQ